jgi:signal transduction histidine kinase/CheY-like chemotaxis protein/HPt (histidine-containing phosphotransfer) domain-containing protein
VNHYLTASGRADWPEIAKEQERRHPQFIGITVMANPLRVARSLPESGNSEAVVFSAGEAPAGPELLDNPYIEQAFQGKTTITSSIITGSGLKFYMASPMPHIPGREAPQEAYILVLTLSGDYFSNLVSTFTVWESGHIFIDDSEGTIIANIRSEWVQGRFNFIQMAKTDSTYEGMAVVVEKVLRGETGVGRFSVSGIPRICSYRPILGSEEGWILGIIAPLPESPIREVDRGLLIVGLVCFFLSVIAAIIGSVFIKKPYEEVAALKVVAEENSKSKSNFLATMSHEMRTPLNAIIGLSELTLDGNIEGEEKENIEKVNTAGRVLLGIINDILDISKIESGKFDLNPIEYSLPSLINDTVTLNTMLIGEKPITFKLFIDDTLPSVLYGDDLRIKQVFNNILSNAFKYTKAGVVEWHITWEKSGADVWLISSVKDSGIGIRREDLDKLFQNYSQVDLDSHRKVEGTGLGLALTKRMAEMMGGNIIVDSEYGKGSVFTVRIRQGQVTDIPIGPKVAEQLKDFQFSDEKHQQHSRLVRLQLPYAKVLVVDDVEPNLVVVKGILKPYGMQVDCVTSGREAIEEIKKGTKYNAIFMDHMMPEMDGIEAVRIIRNDIDSEYAKTVPIIALTANAVRGNEEMFLNSGFQAFLSKPIDINMMDSVIRQWVRDKTREENQAGQAVPEINSGVRTGSRTGKDIPGIDMKRALEQLGDDEEILELTLQSFVENSPSALGKLKNFKPEEIGDYIITVHGLKGVFRNICAGEAAALSARLEQAGKAHDVDFIKGNNDALITVIEKLVVEFKEWLE